VHDSHLSTLKRKGNSPLVCSPNSPIGGIAEISRRETPSLRVPIPAVGVGTQSPTLLRVLVHDIGRHNQSMEILCWDQVTLVRIACFSQEVCYQILPIWEV